MSKIINKAFGEALFGAALVLVGVTCIKAYRPNYATVHCMANVKRL